MKITAPTVKGHGRGKLLGYPTFNLEIPQNFDLKHGIYACWVWIDDKRYMGAMHFGPVPTYDQTNTSLEIFLLDYSDDRHLDELTFETQEYLRPVKHFQHNNQLTNQIRKDVYQVEMILKSNS